MLVVRALDRAHIARRGFRCGAVHVKLRHLHRLLLNQSSQHAIVCLWLLASCRPALHIAVRAGDALFSFVHLLHQVGAAFGYSLCPAHLRGAGKARLLGNNVSCLSSLGMLRLWWPIGHHKIAGLANLPLLCLLRLDRLQLLRKRQLLAHREFLALFVLRDLQHQHLIRFQRRHDRRADLLRAHPFHCLQAPQPGDKHISAL